MLPVGLVLVLAEVFDRLPSAGVGVRATAVDVGSLVDRRLARLVRLALACQSLGRRKPLPQIVGGGGRAHGQLAAAPQQSAQTEATSKEREQALHRADATLPPLLATPVAPSPEAAQGGAADSVHEKGDSGL